MTARVFLGIFEACFGPATVVYFCKSSRYVYFYGLTTLIEMTLALFYTRKEMGMRVS